MQKVASEPDVRLIVFVPAYKQAYLSEIYNHQRIRFIGIEEAPLLSNKKFSFFGRLFSAMIPTYTANLRHRERRHRSHSFQGFLKFFIGRVIIFLFSKNPVAHRLARYLDRRFSPCRYLHCYFDEFQPTALFTTDVFSGMDVLFMQAAKSKKIPVVGMVRSWDNTTTKGLLRVLPDKLIANNEIIKEEAVAIHDVKEKSVFVSGIPQFDWMVRKEHSSREVFFRKISVDPQKRLILFAPAGYLLSDTDWQLCEILKKGFRDSSLPSDVHFLVRNHPGDPASLEKFQPDENFTIERPGTTFGQRGPKLSEMSPDEARHLVDSLFHSEIVVYVNSTIGLDSLPFDKPQIMIEFDGWEKKPYIESVKRYHDEDHMVKYLRTGAVKIVKSPEELFSWVRYYLEQPEMDRENRKTAMNQQLYYLDGRSGLRIADFLLSQLVLQ